MSGAQPRGLVSQEAAVLAAIGSAARTATEIADAAGLSAAVVVAVLDGLVRSRAVAWRDMDLGDGEAVRVWWAVPAALPEAWWRALGDKPGALAA